MDRLRGKRVLITGASNGIGRAIAEGFIAEGADIFVTAFTDARAIDALVAAARDTGRRAGSALIDLADADVDTLFDHAQDTLGGLDVLVNGPAFVSRTPFLQFSEQEYQRTLAVNLHFPFFAIQRFARDCIAQNHGGSIINLSSVSAFRAVSRMAAYQASKAGLSMLTRSCALELAAHGIRVNTLSPGLTATQGNADQWRDAPDLWQNRKRDIPLQRCGIPADMVGAAILLACDESSWMTGADLVIDGGLSCI
ncbi:MULTISPECIES: SDR family NAD(P)-dependent oxidoreductase [unclassified Pseudomonas]|uniref:SDR family NAD(P)-dependent oxidoreductase n=1 Tax=unclassified Pseudomonas TaxID=196821 RepID=UPI002447CAB7|nr:MULTISPECIES: SDR family NAD(P)-dependent oxidoreductase [unclassified Pseudomonas]MDH0304311.1 SDR family oxidoreductase [Pseudomonas sp. GD04091]MDH1983286.1 SDR family oxidoreductase [Pseudomonas sp. GD03689]